MTFNIKSSIKQLVRTFAMLVTLVAALICSMHASADQGDQQATQPLHLQVFFVSAILQRADDATTLKLVHGVQSAQTSAEAELSFIKLIKSDFQGYSVLTTSLCRRVQSGHKPTEKISCGQHLNAGPAGRLG